MSGKPKVYIDANPIIDLVKYEVRVPLLSGQAEHAWHTQQLIRAAQDGVIDLFTCTLSIAECTHVGDRLKEELARPFFMGLLASGTAGFKLIQPTLVVMELARDLRWVQGCNMSGVDSIHVAAAARAGCKELLTNDGKMLSNGDLLLKTHGLRICRPAETNLLPDDYRKRPLFPEDNVEPTAG